MKNLIFTFFFHTTLFFPFRGAFVRRLLQHSNFAHHTPPGPRVCCVCVGAQRFAIVPSRSQQKKNIENQPAMFSSRSTIAQDPSVGRFAHSLTQNYLASTHVVGRYASSSSGNPKLLRRKASSESNGSFAALSDNVQPWTACGRLGGTSSSSP